MSDAQDFDVRKMWRDADPAHRGAVLLCITQEGLAYTPSQTDVELADISPDIAAQNARKLTLGDTYAIAATLLQALAEETP